MTKPLTLAQVMKLDKNDPDDLKVITGYLHRRATEWLAANEAKNAAATLERKTAGEIEKLQSLLDENYNLEINDSMGVFVGITEASVDTINVEKLFKFYPDKAMSIVKATKGDVESTLGDRALLEVTDTNLVEKFSIKKTKVEQ